VAQSANANIVLKNRDAKGTFVLVSDKRRC
jgi:hypothetical protein